MVNVKAQFDKAVIVVKALPPDGPVKPTQDDQLAVSPPSPSNTFTVDSSRHKPVRFEVWLQLVRDADDPLIPVLRSFQTGERG